MDKEARKKYNREWHKNNPEKIKGYNQKYRENNQDKIKKYYSENKKRIALQRKNWYEENKEIVKEGWANMRLLALMKISDKLECVNCGCLDFRILQINHKYGNGKNDRVISKFYRAIINGTRPTKDLEILCCICNILHYVIQRYNIDNYQVIYNNKDSLFSFL